MTERARACPPRSPTRNFVSRTPPSGRHFHQHAQRHELVDVAQCGIRRAPGKGSPFAAGEFAFEAIEHAVEDPDLSFVHGHTGPALPEVRFEHDAGEGDFCALDRAQQAAEEPFEPPGDVGGFLRRLSPQFMR